MYVMMNVRGAHDRAYKNAVARSRSLSLRTSSAEHGCRVSIKAALNLLSESKFKTALTGHYQRLDSLITAPNGMLQC